MRITVPGIFGNVIERMAGKRMINKEETINLNDQYC